MPRKSTASVASAAPAVDTQGALPIPSNEPSVNSPSQPTNTATPTVSTDPTSPSRAKSQAQSSKAAGEKSGRKSAGTTDADEGVSAEKAVKGAGAKPKNDDMTIDDLLLPRSLVSRLSRGSLPPNTSLQKDALLALTKSATVFISYLAHTANSLTSRKTIQAVDVLEAIREMELQGIMGTRLEEELHLFDEGVKGKRKGYRDRIKARESTGTNDTGGQDRDDTIADVMDEDRDADDARGPSQSKRVRIADDEKYQRPENGVDGMSSTKPATHPPTDEEEAEGEDAADDEEELGDDEEEDEAEDDEEEGDENGNEHSDEEMDEEGKDPRRNKGTVLAPDGRIEIASDFASDSHSD